MIDNYEIEILEEKEIKNIKILLKNLSTSYLEDFLLENIVFVTIDRTEENQSKLDQISSFIKIENEGVAYQQ